MRAFVKFYVNMEVIDSERSSLDELNAIERDKHLGGIIFVSILMTVGVIGNSHVLLAYSIKAKHTPRRIFILVLGILDQMASCIGMPFIIFDLSNPLTFDIPLACKALRFMNYFVTASSAFTLLVVAIDRYRKVCVPLSRQITKTTARCLCICVMVLSCMISWPAAVLYGSSGRTINQSNITGTSCLILEEYQSTIYPSVFNSVLLVFVFIVNGCVIVLYCLIGRTIARFRRPTIEIRLVKGSGRIFTLQKHAGIRNLEKGREASKLSIAEDSNTCQTSSTNMSSVSSELRSVESTDCCEEEDTKSKQQSEARGALMKNLYYDEQTVESNAIRQEKDVCNKDIISDHSDEQNNECTSLGEIIIIDRSMTKNNATIKYDNKVEIEGTNITESHIMANETEESNNAGSEDVVNIGNSPNKTQEINVTDTGLDRTETNHPARKSYTKAHRTTFMFCLITIMFIMSYIPHLVLKLLALSVPGFEESLSNEGLYIYNTFIWCFYFNNVVNSIIYWFFDNEFREKVRAFYRRLCCSFSNN